MSINKELYSAFFQPTDNSYEARRAAANAKRLYGHFLKPEESPPTFAERLSDEWRRYWRRNKQQGGGNDSFLFG
jgi:hypothetical protein